MISIRHRGVGPSAPRTRCVVSGLAVAAAASALLLGPAQPASAVSSRDFAVSIRPSNVTLGAGEFSTFSVNVTRGRLFKKALTYRVSSTLPSISTSIRLAAGGAMVTAVAQPTANAAIGQVSVTVTGGGLRRTATSTVTVLAKAPALPTVPPPVVATGDFSVSVDQSSLQLLTGGSGVVGVFVTPSSGYTGSPRFEVVGLPTGVVGAFVQPSSRTGTNLVLTASSAALRGDSVVSVRAIDGDKVRQASFVLRVVAVGPFGMTAAYDPPRSAPGGSATIRVVLSSVGGAPIPEVEITVGGLPNGATLTPASVKTNTAATFTVTFPVGLADGDYAPYVRGVSGTYFQTVTPIITVSSKPLVTLATADQTVLLGNTANYEIVYSPVSGLAAPSYSVSGTPAGASNTVFTAADGRRYVMITTTSSTPRGTYNLTLNAQSGTAITQVPFVLRVV